MEYGRFREAARQAKTQAKNGTQARAIGAVGTTVKAKAKTGKEVVSPKNRKAKTDRMTGGHQRGEARAARKAKVACAALTKLVTLIGGRNHTVLSTAHSQKKKSISAR